MIAGVAFDAALADPFSYRVPDGWQLAPGQRVLAQLRGALSFKKAERKTYVPSNQPKVLPVVSEKQRPNLPGAQRNENIIQETRQLGSPGPVPLPTADITADAFSQSSKVGVTTRPVRSIGWMNSLSRLGVRRS